MELLVIVLCFCVGVMAVKNLFSNGVDKVGPLNVTIADMYIARQYADNMYSIKEYHERQEEIKKKYAFEAYVLSKDSGNHNTN